MHNLKLQILFVGEKDDFNKWHYQAPQHPDINHGHTGGRRQLFGGCNKPKILCNR